LKHDLFRSDFRVRVSGEPGSERIALLCALLALALMGVRAGLATLEARKNAAADAKQHGGD